MDHIGLQPLWEYFARYPYLPRLRDEHVLLGAVQDGIGQTTWQEFFAYASAYDGERQRYGGLKAGEMGSVVPRAQRFYATVDLSPLTVAGDASKIAEHVVQHLSSLPTARVRLTLGLERELPTGCRNRSSAP